MTESYAAKAIRKFLEACLADLRGRAWLVNLATQTPDESIETVIKAYMEQKQ